MRITKKQLRRIIREEKRKLNEDHVGTELAHLRKNIGNDEEHLHDLKKDIEDDHEEEERAEQGRKHEGIMKITKRQLRRVIQEERVKLLREQAGAPMSAATADAAQLLQTVYYNLDDLSAGAEPDIAAELEMQMELIKDAIHALGVVLP